MSRWEKFSGLSASKKLLLIEAAVMLPITRLALSTLGLNRWQALLGGRRLQEPFSSTREAAEHEAKLIARLVRAAANHGIFAANCLSQSVVLCWFLKRHGLPATISFGSRKVEQRLEAHAWVECLGLTLNEDRGIERRFTPFARVAGIES